MAELWIPSNEDIVLINKAAPFDVIKHSAQQSTLLMATDVWAKLQDGDTSLEELIRVLPYSCIHQLRASSSNHAGGNSSTGELEHGCTTG